MPTVAPPFRAFLAGFLCLVVAGCAAVPLPTRSPHTGAGDPLGACAELFAGLDHRTVAADAVDGGVYRVEGHPYLRVDRFLASLADRARDPAAFPAWIDRMQALDLEARRGELARSRPTSDPPEADAVLLRQARDCGDRMKAADFARVDGREAFRHSVVVPDEYRRLPRILGVYPLVGLFVSSGVADWHAAARQAFSTTPPPPDSDTVVYTAAEPPPSAAPNAAPTDALGIPQHTGDELTTQLRAHAPTWHVATATDHDRIGTPSFGAAGVLEVDITRPAVFTYLGYTQFAGDVLTQLSYTVWFPARPRVSAFDIYGGFLDGVIFRVTLDTDGAPLLYESVHACGCYYAAYPTLRLRARTSIDYDEPPLILQAPPGTGAAGSHVGLALTAGAHQVVRVFVETGPPRRDAVALNPAPYAELQTLPLPDGRRGSLFGSDGLVPGSERLERFILWPTGVPSPGAMRQLGRHAVAFVGERHFDDAFALDRMFVRAGTP
jgi:hypothetical protein